MNFQQFEVDTRQVAALCPLPRNVQKGDVPRSAKAPNPVPFLMVTADNRVGIHDRDTAELVPASWTGICSDVGDQTSFWYIGLEGRERSFTKLMAREHHAASAEAQIRRIGQETSLEEGGRATGIIAGEVRS